VAGRYEGFKEMEKWLMYHISGIICGKIAAQHLKNEERTGGDYGQKTIQPYLRRGRVAKVL